MYVNIVPVKSINITYSECPSIAIVIQHAKRMRRIMLPSVAYLTVQYFFTLSQKRYDSWMGGGVIKHKTCVLVISTILA